MADLSDDRLPSWRETPVKQAIAEFVAAVTDPGSAEFVPERERIAVFDNDGTLWTEQPLYAQLAFALDRTAQLGHPTSLEKLRAGGMPALVDRGRPAPDSAAGRAAHRRRARVRLRPGPRPGERHRPAPRRRHRTQVDPD